ncbi:uncharacterized protein RHOBADRAFT_51343 [Rhodotorula graminis WP1]|uniref:PB1 domain-containing protein n=1 Tax=Rhodotorula graminis (strain WP1) TaxID=578459 RepID=A0A194S9V5_RHOGW|nr:uncharacterized protein RHOBADRAFT_51343 [Rhodotorula graminis WP1]KPV77498.1 hypothetical protein RHOBADRAFT_51343 [Rhodotorula graminis WP1]
MLLPAKFRLTHPDGTTTIRRATLDSRTTYPALVSLVRDRFQLVPAHQVELLYKDDDGDDITFTTDVELREYLDTATTGSFVLRLHTHKPDAATSTTTYHDDTADVEDWEFEDGEGALASDGHHDSAPTPALIDTVAADAADAADPDETPLTPAPASATIAQRTQALIDAEFPTSSSAAAADPIDEPLPQAHADGPTPDMPFTNLPASLASLLSGLPSHAGALGTHVSTLLASPQSALGRLSVLASDPMGAGVSSLDLSDLGRSVAQLSAHLSDAAREVVEGVRKEADSVRTEFEQLRAEVAREKSRFEDEVRHAMEQAKQTPSPFAPRPAAAAAAASSRETTTDEYEMGPTTSGQQQEQDEDVESSDEGEPEEPYAQRAASSPAARAPPTPAERLAKEQRRKAREQRRQDKERRREARKADKAATRNAAKAGFVTAHELLRNQEQAQAGGMASSPLEADGGSSRMPGSLPGSHQAPSPPSTSSPPSPRFVPASQLLSSAPPGAWTAPTVQHADDGRPVLLTNLLLACEELGMDVQGHPQLRTLLTDIWCDSNGRGLSRMIERALDELADRD